MGTERFEDPDFAKFTDEKNRNTMEPDYWGKLERYGIDRAKGYEFLQALWAAFVLDQHRAIEKGESADETDESYLRELRQAMRDEKKIRESIESFQARYGRLPAGITLSDVEYDEDDQRIIRAVSQKNHKALCLALYVLDDAERIFGQPMYEAVATAVNVILDEDCTVDGLALKTIAMQRRRGR